MFLLIFVNFNKNTNNFEYCMKQFYSYFYDFNRRKCNGEGNDLNIYIFFVFKIMV